MRIDKYLVEISDEIEITMPFNARVLTVQMQNDHPYVWALVDADAQPERRKFAVRGAGHEFNTAGLIYVGTFQMRGGRFVFHLFERAT